MTQKNEKTPTLIPAAPDATSTVGKVLRAWEKNHDAPKAIRALSGISEGVDDARGSVLLLHVPLTAREADVLATIKGAKVAKVPTTPANVQVYKLADLAKEAGIPKNSMATLTRPRYRAILVAAGAQREDGTPVTPRTGLNACQALWSKASKAYKDATLPEVTGETGAGGTADNPASTSPNEAAEITDAFDAIRQKVAALTSHPLTDIDRDAVAGLLAVLDERETRLEAAA